MQINKRRYAREIGTALAVLAIYVLTLLLPLHQAAGLQRDLDAMGFATLDSWSVCQPLVVDEDGKPDEATAVNCPATGVAKYEMAAVLPPVLVIEPPTTADAIAYAAPETGTQTLLPDHIGQSRAPPVAV